MEHVIDISTREQVNSVNQEIFGALKKSLAFVPNHHSTTGYSSNGLSRYLAYQNANSSLSNQEKEAVNLVINNVNGCVYCQSAHTGRLSDEQIADLRKDAVKTRSYTH